MDTNGATSLVARVRDFGEAGQAAQSGVDGVLLMPGSGVSREAYDREVGRVVEALGHRIAVGHDTHASEEAEIRFVGAPAWSGAPEAPILAGLRDALPEAAALDILARKGLNGVMIESSTRLVDRIDLVDLAATLQACRTRGLACGLSGGIELPDVPRLLALGPAMLAMGRWLRRSSGPDASLDPAIIKLVKKLMRESAAATYEAPQPHGPRLDRIFVRDLVVDMAIGAYAEEVGRTQRVRFTVEAEILPSRQPIRDMPDVVSYDLISDAIRRIAAAGHVTFVESLAEAIADEVLVHPRIHAVRIVVEKLDLGPGSVGVEIWRGKGPYG